MTLSDSIVRQCHTILFERGTKMDEGKTYRITVRLDVRQDADLIAWLEAQPRGTRSDAVRATLRGAMESEAHGQQTIDHDTLRQLIADELAKALQGMHLYSPSHHDEPAVNGDTEAKYGAKLDRLLESLGEGEQDPNLQ
jgi:Arc/MetJ-type ribon-helix-helix transcriptional regulator